MEMDPGPSSTTTANASSSSTNDALPDRASMDEQVGQVLLALDEARVRYVVWGAAACVFHGGRWLWKSQDYEVLIDDWFDGPQMRQAVDAITARCSDWWAYDADLDEHAWAATKGDRAPTRPLRRFRNVHLPTEFGVVLAPMLHSRVVSMHPEDLSRSEAQPGWVFPSLKNYVEGQLRFWSHEGRNSALLDLAEVAGAQRLTHKWANEVGLDLSRSRRSESLHIPSEWEVWEELVLMVLTCPNRQRASARFQARKAEKEAQRQVEAQIGQSGPADGA